MSKEVLKSWGDAESPQVIMAASGRNKYIVRAVGIPYMIVLNELRLANACFSSQIARIKRAEGLE